MGNSDILKKYDISLDFDHIPFKVLYPYLKEKLLTKQITLMSDVLIKSTDEISIIKEKEINSYHYYFLTKPNNDLIFNHFIDDFQLKYQQDIIQIDNITIEQMVIDEFKKQNLTISLAESCTGGMIASRLISIPGASAVIDSSLIAYSIKAKEQILLIDPDIINKFGVTSNEVALMMAKGIQSVMKTNVAIGVTGFAGGSELDDNDGLFYYAILIGNQQFVQKCKIRGTRNEVRYGQATHILSQLYRLLKNFISDMP